MSHRFAGLRFLLLCCFLLTLAGCKPSEESHIKAIIGAVLLDGTGGPPISNSVVLIAGSRVRAVGARPNIPIPAGAEKVNGAGKFLIPGLIDVSSSSPAKALSFGVTGLLSAGAFRQTDDPADARRQVAELATRRVDAIEISMDGLKPAVAEAILDETRKHNIPVTAHIRTLAEAKFLVGNGVAGFLDMIRDTEEIDAAFLDRLRNLQLVFAPALVRLDRSRPEFQTALHNTRRLAAHGIPIAVASGAPGQGTLEETELLVEAGLAPNDVLVAATRHGALALHRLEELGTIERGKRADLLLLNANPAEDIRNLRQIDRLMVDGGWVEERSAAVVAPRPPPPL